MTRNMHAEIRALLLAHPDGLTRVMIAALSNANRSTISQALESMPDVYIDRWTTGKTALLQPVFIAVPIPEDCPKPTTERKLDARPKLDGRGADTRD